MRRLLRPTCIFSAVFHCVTLFCGGSCYLILCCRTTTGVFCIHTNDSILRGIFRIYHIAKLSYIWALSELFSWTPKQSLNSSFMFPSLLSCNIFDGCVNLCKEIIVCYNPSLVSCAKDVLVIVCKLLSTDSTNKMTGSRLWLFDKVRPLFSRG